MSVIVFNELGISRFVDDLLVRVVKCEVFNPIHVRARLKFETFSPIIHCDIFIFDVFCRRYI